MDRIPKNSVALAGEFAVLSQLVFRGYDASLTLGHTKNIDILVFEPKTKRRYEVEVKTNLEFRRSDRPHDSKLFGKYITDWQMHKKHEHILDSHLFYCFVNINAPDREKPTFRFFIVPSVVVAKYVREEHQLWQKNGLRGETLRRSFRIGLANERKVAVPAPAATKYENNWGFKTLAKDE